MKILDKIENPSPVINRQIVISCQSFTGEISSKTGIIARGLYIAKIIEQPRLNNGEKTVEVISCIPDIIIQCTSECEIPCKNLFKNKKDLLEVPIAQVVENPITKEIKHSNPYFH